MTIKTLHALSDPKSPEMKAVSQTADHARLERLKTDHQRLADEIAQLEATIAAATALTADAKP